MKPWNHLDISWRCWPGTCHFLSENAYSLILVPNPSCKIPPHQVSCLGPQTNLHATCSLLTKAVRLATCLHFFLLTSYPTWGEFPVDKESCWGTTASCTPSRPERSLIFWNLATCDLLDSNITTCFNICFDFSHFSYVINTFTFTMSVLTIEPAQGPGDWEGERRLRDASWSPKWFTREP